jgi:hypothetical protein
MSGIDNSNTWPSFPFAGRTPLGEKEELRPGVGVAQKKPTEEAKPPHFGFNAKML